MVFFCFIEQVSCFFEIMLYLCDNFKTNGALAHLARAFDWQSKGGRFESCILHIFFLLRNKKPSKRHLFNVFFCYNPLY